MSKLVSVESGGDWADASYQLLSVPDELELEDAQRIYREQGGYHGTGKFFAQWLEATFGAEIPDHEVWED